MMTSRGWVRITFPGLTFFSTVSFLVSEKLILDLLICTNHVDTYIIWLSKSDPFFLLAYLISSRLLAVLLFKSEQ